MFYLPHLRVDADMLACATIVSIIRNLAIAAAETSSLNLCALHWATASRHGAVYCSNVKVVTRGQCSEMSRNQKPATSVQDPSAKGVDPRVPYV
jgi:hypothetical protein